VVIGETPLRDAYRLLAWGPWRWALERSPPGWEVQASRHLGRIAGALPGSTRALVRTNLARAFPDAPAHALDRLARATFAAHFANQQASFSFARMRPETETRYLRWVGLAHLEAARAEGVGVVLVHPHMGPAQLPLCALGARGIPVHQIGGGEVALERSRVGRWASTRRAALEQRLPATLHDGKRYLRAVVRALHAGEVVFTAGDGTGGGHELGRRAVGDVMGQRMRLPLAPVWLATHGRARLHPLHCYAEGSRHVAVIGPRMAVPEVPDSDVSELAAWLDVVLRAHPQDWLLWDAFAPGQLLEDDE
jgi:lauroyl/myristoyl acyltransferase